MNGHRIYFDEDTLMPLALVYGRALGFVKEIFDVLSKKMDTFDYEVSFDETNTITTPEALLKCISMLSKVS
ncbi:MAG: tagaturonate epimerase family protein [Actinobacteria bacterium]|nr:tagaturonate epimerase family protein [Actinomycetota bacterium]